MPVGSSAKKPHSQLIVPGADIPVDVAVIVAGSIIAVAGQLCSSREYSRAGFREETSADATGSDGQSLQFGKSVEWRRLVHEFGDLENRERNGSRTGADRPRSVGKAWDT